VGQGHTPYTERADSRKRGQVKSVQAKTEIKRPSELFDWPACIKRWKRKGGYLDQIYGPGWRDEPQYPVPHPNTFKEDENATDTV